MASTQQGIKDFSAIRIRLASPEDILTWSHGEVTKPETINYRTQKPEKDGLFSEAIFGPTKDFECYCGKYRRIRYKGIVCDKCGVEVTRSIVRRERMGHIQLAAPVSHIWFLRGIPSKMGLLLDSSIQALEKVIYFASYIIVDIDEDARERVIDEIEKEYKAKTKNDSSKGLKRDLKKLRDQSVDEVRRLSKYQIISEVDYYDLSLKYGEVFRAGIGAEAIRDIFSQMNLEEIRDQVQKELEKTTSVAQMKKLNRRLRVVESMIRAHIRPEWMLLTTLPVIPPELRPMVPLDGGRFATSDVNDLYRRVINRNNRLKKLLELNAPEVIIRNEKRMLQEAVDALIDNSARRGQASTASAGGRRRALRSLADMLKGKQGRFRQNLLGKRVDYSGRSVIVVGPELKLYQTGLPKRMALEIFKPFIIHKLIYEKEVAPNIRTAGRLIDEETDEVWASLEEVIQDRAVLLNRAPTLHRLGIQAFKPTLIEGSAIQVHPLVCSAFNADFDGDQMAVHLPLSAPAQEEAHKLMLASTNLRKRATGDPIANPSQDMILGVYWLTRMDGDASDASPIFASFNEAITAHDAGAIEIHQPIKVRSVRTKNEIIETTVGRIIFNLSLPSEIGFTNDHITKKLLSRLTSTILTVLGQEEAQAALDRMKEFGFSYATISGISWGMDDLKVPQEKTELIKNAEKEVAELRAHYDEGLLTTRERKQRSSEIWNRTKNQLSDLLKKTLERTNPVYAIFDSGARGSMANLDQLAGMKGVVVNPGGEMIEVPILSSFKEGFNVLEYFISTHGARKGLTDTALKTANAGYLTRRLVDVAQDVVVREIDCGDEDGVVKLTKDSEKLGSSLGERVVGRVSLTTFRDKEGALLIKKGDLIREEHADVIDASGVEEFAVRSPISCKAPFGICAKCFGADLATSELIEIGQAVGIVTAQSIGEPATQLTMRTFHVGGVAGVADITLGLPRVEEIFEARTPKGKALLSEVAGKVKEITQKEGQVAIRIEPESNGKKKVEETEYLVPQGTFVLVGKGDLIGKGTQLTDGSKDLKEMVKLSGPTETARYILTETSSIYSNQGAHINEKYLEIIIRQMFSRVRVTDAGDTNLLPGDVVEKGVVKQENKRLTKKQRKAEVSQLLLGITKVALTTQSFLSAASFQETTKTLTEAAARGKTDHLVGLKENVIIGRLIPAGTGYREADFEEEE